MTKQKIMIVDDDKNICELLRLYLDGLMKRAKYTMWCFGRYHLDQKMGSSASAVYKKVLPLWQPLKKGR